MDQGNQDQGVVLTPGMTIDGGSLPNPGSGAAPVLSAVPGLVQGAPVQEPAPAAAVAWPAAPSLVDVPDRAELLQRAAAAPSHAFSLPQDIAPVTAAQVPGIATQPAMQQPVAAPVEAPITTPAPDPITPIPEQVVPPAPITAQVTAPAPITAQVTTPTPLVLPKKKRPWLVVVLVLLIIAMINGAAAALAYFGYPVPLYTPWITGLGTNGDSVNQQAITHVAARNRYTYSGRISLVLDSAENSDATNTGSDQLQGEAQEITRLVVNMLLGEQSEPEKSLVQSATIDVNDRGSVPFVLQQLPGQQDQVRLNATFPDVQGNALTGVAKDDLQKTLLGAVIMPLSLSNYLAANGTETGTSKIVRNGEVAQRYQFTGVPAALSGKLPEGLAITNVRTQVDYQWQTAKPLAYVMKATVTYQSRDYQYTVNMAYQKWDLPIGTSVAPFDTLNQIAEKQLAVDPLSFFAGRLGIRYQALPTTLPVITTP